MATPTSYSANLTFGGRVDSSLDKAVAQIQKQLQGIQKDTALFSESISGIGTGILAVGTAFLGLRTGIDALEDLADAGKRLSDITNQVGVNIGKMVSWSGRTKEFEDKLTSFNLELRKTSGYATDIAESFEAGLTGQGFKSLSQIESLTKRFELLAASQNRELTVEDSKAAAANLGTAVKTGGDSGVDALRAMGLSLPYADQQRYRAIQNYPGMQGQAYDAREKFIEDLLNRQAPEGAFGKMAQRPQSAGYLMGQEQTEISQKLGQGVNDLFAPVQQGITKALQNLEQSGELEKFDAWSKDAGTRLSSFFQKFIEPKLPGALQKLEDIIDAIGGKIDALPKGKDFLGPEPAEAGGWKHIHWDRLGGLIGQGWNAISGSVNKDFEKSLGERLHTPASSAGMVSPTSIYDSVPAFASGGIVTRPTIGLIGEKEPEGVFPLSFLGSDVKDLTKANTEATKKETDALTALTQKLDDNLSFLQQQGQFQTLGQMPGQMPGQSPSGGGGSGGAPWKRGHGGAAGPGNNVSGSIDGVQFTHYGYKGDSTPDWNSAHGIGDHENKLTEGLSVALTQSERKALFGYTGKSRGQKFTMGGHQWEDDDTAPESNRRVDVYDKSNSLLAQFLESNKKHIGSAVQGSRAGISFGSLPVGIGVVGGGTFLNERTNSGGDSLSQTLDKAQQALKLGTNRLDDPRIKAKSSIDSGTETKTETTTPSTTTPVIHYSPHITIHATGHDTNSLVSSLKEALRTHGDDLGHHIVRVLQNHYRSEVQRVNYA